MPALLEAPFLKPCPFCGCELESRWNRNNPSARCVTEDCMGSKLPVLCLDVPGSIEAWNARAVEQPAQSVAVQSAPALTDDQIWRLWWSRHDGLSGYEGIKLGEIPVTKGEFVAVVRSILRHEIAIAKGEKS